MLFDFYLIYDLEELIFCKDLFLFVALRFLVWVPWHKYAGVEERMGKVLANVLGEMRIYYASSNSLCFVFKKLVIELKPLHIEHLGKALLFCGDTSSQNDVRRKEFHHNKVLLRTVMVDLQKKKRV